jgi:hypothetical protein
MNAHLYSDMSGVLRSYFMDNDGQMFLDEQGNLDDTITIPFYVRLGRDQNGTEHLKNYQGFYIAADNAAGAGVKVAFDGNDFLDIGTLKQRMSKVPIPAGKNARGRDYDIEITQNSEGEPISVEAIITYFNDEEDNFG